MPEPDRDSVAKVERDEPLSEYATKLLGRPAWCVGWRDVDRQGFWVEVHLGDPVLAPHQAARELLLDKDRDEMRRTTRFSEVFGRDYMRLPYQRTVESICRQLGAATARA